MPNEIEIQNLKKDYPEFFLKTPAKLVDFLFSEKTSEKIADICKKNGVADESQVEKIAQRITWVLLGKLPSGNLAAGLELWVKLTPETAKKVADEANQFISSAMAQLKSEVTIPQAKPEVRAERPVVEEPPKKPLSKDSYREPII